MIEAHPSRPQLHLIVTGLPSPQGSKRGFPVHRKDGTTGVALVESAGDRVKTWRQDVRTAAERALNEDPRWAPHPSDALAVEIRFALARPRSHYGTGRNAGTLKATAPSYPTTKPDLDKLERAVLDALTSAGVYPDDSQVAVLHGHKRYADDGRPGAAIAIAYLEDAPK